MTEFFDFVRSLGPIWNTVIGIVGAMICAGVIGMERGRQRRAAGMRTHILVCLGATLTAMSGLFAFQNLSAGDPLRIAAQVISGIGFLGVGTILIKGRFQITGLTTAAGLWTVAAIGIALGLRFYEGALFAFIASAVTVVFLSRLEHRLNRKKTRFGIYLEISSDESVRTVLDYLESNLPASDLQVTPPRSGKSGNVGIEANLIFQKSALKSASDVTRELEELPDVVYAIESI